MRAALEGIRVLVVEDVLVATLIEDMLVAAGCSSFVRKIRTISFLKGCAASGAVQTPAPGSDGSISGIP